MNLLVIGGTRFVGRHFVDAALAAGHALTLFNRGQSGAAPAGVVQRLGDRRSDLSALAQGSWDAVVDTCGYLPAEVRAMAEGLRGRVDRYLYISSVSAYADASTANPESAPLGRFDSPEAALTEVVDCASYGPLKALCEAQVLAAFGERALILRPGLVVGPHDPTQRFTYWPARLARATPGQAVPDQPVLMPNQPVLMPNHPVLVPGPADAAVQYIDARDLAGFMLTLLARPAGAAPGIFNVVGRPGQYTRADLMRACAAAAGTAPDLHWVDIARLLALGLQAWRDLPLALPDEPGLRRFLEVDNRRATAAGLLTRTLADTVADTLAWHRSLPLAQQAFDQAGLTPEREAAALADLAAGRA